MGSHPGGDDILLSRAGTDATKDFEAAQGARVAETGIWCYSALRAVRCFPSIHIHDMIWHDMTCHGMAWHGIALHYITLHTYNTYAHCFIITLEYMCSFYICILQSHTVTVYLIWLISDFDAASLGDIRRSLNIPRRHVCSVIARLGFLKGPWQFPDWLRT